MGAPERRTERGLDRFLNFSDAVVAIAITLLILPAVDDVTDDRTHSVADFFSENGDRLIAFAVSFLVIGQFWLGHHQTFERVKTYSRGLMMLNLLWLLTIVFLPLPTELLGVEGPDDPWTRAFYIGSVLVSSVVLLALEVLIDRSPALRTDLEQEPPSLTLRFVTPSLLVSALVVAVTVPAIGMWAMLLLFLAGPVSTRLAPPQTA